MAPWTRCEPPGAIIASRWPCDCSRPRLAAMALMVLVQATTAGQLLPATQWGSRLLASGLSDHRLGCPCGTGGRRAGRASRRGSARVLLPRSTQLVAVTVRSAWDSPTSWRCTCPGRVDPLRSTCCRVTLRHSRAPAAGPGDRQGLAVEARCVRVAPIGERICTRRSMCVRCARMWVEVHATRPTRPRVEHGLRAGVSDRRNTV